MPLVADFLRKKKPDVVAQTGDRLGNDAYPLVVENGYRSSTVSPFWMPLGPTIAAALPRFLAGPNDRFKTIINALVDFLNFTGRWDEMACPFADAEGCPLIGE